MKILMKNKLLLLVAVLLFLSALSTAASAFFAANFADSTSKFLPYVFGFGLLAFLSAVAILIFLAMKKIRSCPPKSESKWGIVALWVSVAVLILVTLINHE